MLRLAKEMKDQGFSQNRLAARAAITPADLSKIVNRRMVPYPSQLRKLAAALEWPEDRTHELMEDVTENAVFQL